jgi:hypothetical protein
MPEFATTALAAVVELKRLHGQIEMLEGHICHTASNWECPVFPASVRGDDIAILRNQLDAYLAQQDVVAAALRQLRLELLLDQEESWPTHSKVASFPR